jgi:hypothetical protein
MPHPSPLARAVTGDPLRQEALRLTQDDPRAAAWWLWLRWVARRQGSARRVMLRNPVEMTCPSE